MTLYWSIFSNYSTDQLDDEQIEQLMLESEGFDTLQDVKALEDPHPHKSPQKVVASEKSNWLYAI